jgi:TonB family protein
MRLVLICLFFATTSIAFALKAQNPAAVVAPKHLELPSQYEIVARAARLQGTVTVRLTISSDGDVIAAEPSSTDALLREHSILQAKTAELTRRWKFSCSNCSKDDEYQYTVTFIYKLEGKESRYADTQISVDLPDQVTIRANPPTMEAD